MKQQTEKKLQANLKAINNDFNTVILADIEVKFKLMELEAIRILIDDCEKLHMAHPNGRVCGAKRPKCEAERSHHL